MAYHNFTLPLLTVYLGKPPQSKIRKTWKKEQDLTFTYLPGSRRPLKDILASHDCNLSLPPYPLCLDKQLFLICSKTSAELTSLRLDCEKCTESTCLWVWAMYFNFTSAMLITWDTCRHAEASKILSNYSSPSISAVTELSMEARRRFSVFFAITVLPC